MIGTILFLTVLASTNANYQPSMALKMMHMSSIAYESKDSIDAWNCHQCKGNPVQSQKTFQNPQRNTQGFTAYLAKQQAIVVSFRGSSDIKNWLTNLDTVFTTYNCNGCKVHQGFNKAYLDIAHIVRTQVQKLLSLYRNSKIIVTGHSLGGALAILCALDLKLIHASVDLVYTMGQPRVGNPQFATYYQSLVPNTFRIVNYADIVTHSPPMNFNFRHGGHQVWYTNQMQNYKICVSEDQNCANSVNTLRFSIDDHSLLNYQKIKVSYSLFDIAYQYYYSLQNQKEIEVDQVSYKQMQLNSYFNAIQQIKLSHKQNIKSQ